MPRSVNRMTVANVAGCLQLAFGIPILGPSREQLHTELEAIVSASDTHDPDWKLLDRLAEEYAGMNRPELQSNVPELERCQEEVRGRLEDRFERTSGDRSDQVVDVLKRALKEPPKKAEPKKRESTKAPPAKTVPTKSSVPPEHESGVLDKIKKFAEVVSENLGEIAKKISEEAVVRVNEPSPPTLQGDGYHMATQMADWYKNLHAAELKKGVGADRMKVKKYALEKKQWRMMAANDISIRDDIQTFINHL